MSAEEYQRRDANKNQRHHERRPRHIDGRIRDGEAREHRRHQRRTDNGRKALDRGHRALQLALLVRRDLCRHQALQTGEHQALTGRNGDAEVNHPACIGHRIGGIARHRRNEANDDDAALAKARDQVRCT